MDRRTLLRIKSEFISGGTLLKYLYICTIVVNSSDYFRVKLLTETFTLVNVLFNLYRAEGSKVTCSSFHHGETAAEDRQVPSAHYDHLR